MFAGCNCCNARRDCEEGRETPEQSRSGEKDGAERFLKASPTDEARSRGVLKMNQAQEQQQKTTKAEEGSVGGEGGRSEGKRRGAERKVRNRGRMGRVGGDENTETFRGEAS